MADSQRKTAQIFNLSDASQMTSFNCTPTIYQGALTQVNRGIYARTEWSINKFQIGKRYTISVQFNNVDASSINVRILDSDGSTVIANSDTTTNTSGNLKVTFTARNVKQYIRFYSNTLNTGNTSTVVFSDIMLNEGETALPYEPYGWLHSLRKLTTATEAVENPLYSDGTAITAYTLKGNTTQSGTPTPSNPVDVNGVGVRTENLFDFSTMRAGVTGRYLNQDGTTNPQASWNITDYIPCDGTEFTIRLQSAGYNTAICLYDADKNYITGKKYDGLSTITVTSSVPAKYIRFSIGASWTENGLMLNEGSTLKPYEPYGFKIPISNGQQTIDIYIGDLPLLKSLDGTAVDEISNGTLTRRVDSDGSVLPTPTTTQITMPSIPTTEGANSITVDTTVQPSEFTATWTGWHDASVKEYDGSQWNE